MVGQIAKKKNSLSYILFDDFKKIQGRKNVFKSITVVENTEEEKIMKGRKRNPRV